MNTHDLKSFNYLENGNIQFSLFNTLKSTTKLDSGFYEVSLNPHNNMLELKTSPNKEAVRIHDFPDKERLDNLFVAFFDKNVISTMNNLGFNHKVGVLLYGKEGTGKSTIIRHYATNAVTKHNAIVFYFSPAYKTQCWEFIRQIRTIQKNPIIVILEEIDQHISNGGEGIIKTILDGNLSIDNTIFLGATNYFESIPNAIKNRPSRFKYCFDIEGIQDSECIKNILAKLIGSIVDDVRLVEISESLKGSTLDQIKQYALDKIMDLKSYEKKVKKIGFIQ